MRSGPRPFGTFRNGSGTAHTTTRHARLNFASEEEETPRVEVNKRCLTWCMVHAWWWGSQGSQPTYRRRQLRTHPARCHLPHSTMRPPTDRHSRSVPPPPTPACGRAEAALRAPGAAVRNVPGTRSGPTLKHRRFTPAQGISWLINADTLSTQVEGRPESRPSRRLG